MSDLVVPVLLCAVFVAVTPNLWTWCDRQLVILRSAPVADAPVVTTDGGAVTTDAASALALVARNVRAGMEASAAVTSVHPPTAGLLAVQRMLADGVPLADALRHGSTEASTLAACMHHGQFSPGAIDSAVSVMRREEETRREILTALSSARASTRLLTALPFSFLALAFILSAGVRSDITTPIGAVAVVLGAALNRGGARWMNRAAMRAAHAGDTQRDFVTHAATLAHHIRAGGNLLSASALLAGGNPCWAAAHSALLRGERLSDALAPVRPTDSPLVDVILSAHADGQPLLPALDALVEHTAHAAHEATRAAVARLPAVSTLPLVSCVLPSFVLVALIPVVLAATGGSHAPVL